MKKKSPVYNSYCLVPHGSWQRSIKGTDIFRPR